MPQGNIVPRGPLSLGLAQEVRLYQNAGAPVNGTSGTYAGIAEAGALLVDTTNFSSYLNTGTQLSPIWTRDGNLQAVITKGIAYTATQSDDVVLVTTGGLTITLPAATAVTPGRMYVIKNVNTATTATTVNGGGTNIDGAATFSLAVGYTACRVVSDGTNWFTI